MPRTPRPTRRSNRPLPRPGRRVLLAAAAGLAVSANVPFGGPAGLGVSAAGQTFSGVSPSGDAAGTAPSLWADFTHYVLIASPALAAEAAQGLLDLEPDALLDAVEASDRNAANIFQRGRRMDDVRQLAGDLEARIQEARIARSREEDRIARDIEQLARGQRAFVNATERLASAGQYAAPLMLSALEDAERSELHPEIMRSLVEIGRPVVTPLSVALPRLGATTQGQVARVLGEIGYPQALPALKRVIEDPAADATARASSENAARNIAANASVDPNLSAAELYLRLGLDAYDTATDNPGGLDGYDSATDRGAAWHYDPQPTVTGGPRLVPVTVPGPVLGDVRAMQAARDALALDPDLDGALSLYVLSNLRRENRLPEGETDPSYAGNPYAPAFYAMVAGPRRLHDVLDVALSDRDTPLALDAIDALAATASLDALAPLVRGLTYPSAPVRFRSALALSRAQPTQGFESDFRVVPILADAVRRGDAPVALVVAGDNDTRNRLVDSAGSLGYRALPATSVADARGVITNSPGIDLLLVEGEAGLIRATADAARDDYKLGSTPVVALTDPAGQPPMA